MRLTTEVNIVCVVSFAGDKTSIFFAENRFTNIFCNHFSILHLLCGSRDGADDILITGTAAVITLQPFTNFSLSEFNVIPAGGIHQVDTRHYHPRRTEPALESMTSTKCRLHWMQVIFGTYSFNRGHLGTFRLNGQHGTSLDGITIQMNSASATLTCITANMSTSKPKVLSNKLP
jgi:hypothetical protein